VAPEPRNKAGTPADLENTNPASPTFFAGCSFMVMGELLRRCQQPTPCNR